MIGLFCISRTFYTFVFLFRLNKNTVTLRDINLGEKAIITKIRGRGAFRKRITEMGFVLGKEVTVLKKAPLQDPVEYSILGYNVLLRNSEAELIEVEEVSEANLFPQNYAAETFEIDTEQAVPIASGKVIYVALVGNPNSGKTTLFNYASGSHERVGNYGGVTVDAHEARFRLKDYEFRITDLPGTYSITAYTPEELFVRDFICDAMPDVVVNVLDASNLERNLYLTTQLIDMDIQVVAALNMFDELENRGDKLNYAHLGNMLGIPFVPTVASRGKGVNELFLKLIEVYENRDKTARHIHINYGESIEAGISAIQKEIRQPENVQYLHKISSRYLALKLLEKDSWSNTYIENFANTKAIEETVQTQIKRVETEHHKKEDTETVIADAKYGFIAGALEETLKENKHRPQSRSRMIDHVFTHRFLGIPIFIFFMWLTFFATFKLGAYPMEWIEMLVDRLSSAVTEWMPDGMLKDLLVDGIIAGVGGVIVFLPNIVFLYLFISLMEDTGYMARAVFIMDKVMHKIGLHGKSFIPLLMGFGCNVPAVLSTRIIESRRDRLVTMLINPFMSCSARLPVYVLLITAFFPRHQGSWLFLMYLIGIAIAVLSALLFRKTLFRKKDVPFVMELPPYRIPTLRSVGKHVWNRSGQYLRKIGGVILIASIIIWFLGYFPRNRENHEKYEAQITQINRSFEQKMASDSLSQSGIVKLEEEHNHQLADVETAAHAENQANSYIGRIGKTIEPLMRPLGFDWRMCIAILTGVSAKEVVVGTLGVLYQSDRNENGDHSLVSKLQHQVHTDGPNIGTPTFTPLIAFTFMLFILVYFPCIGVVSAISRESGSWKWAAFTVIYTTGLAYLLSLAVFQIGSAF